MGCVCVCVGGGHRVGAWGWGRGLEGGGDTGYGRVGGGYRVAGVGGMWDGGGLCSGVGGSGGGAGLDLLPLCGMVATDGTGSAALAAATAAAAIQEQRGGPSAWYRQ